MTSRIEQIIQEIEEYIDGCKYQMLSSDKIIVNKDEIEELINELKVHTPDEIKKYQKIIANKEAILADARAKADQIISEAQIHTNELVSEHEIMRQAYAQANEVVLIATNQAQDILDKATMDANSIRTAAMTYTEDMLANLESIITATMDTSKAKYENYFNNLKNCLDIVLANKAELSPEEEHQKSIEREIDLSFATGEIRLADIDIND